MSEAKIQLTVGGLSFSGEGEQEWLEHQLHYILEAAPALAKTVPLQLVGGNDTPNPQIVHDEEPFTQPLASYLREKGGESNQQKRFLTTADWLRMRGSTDLKTAAVTAALRDGRQKKLTNAADCLNKNVTQGLCEKSGAGFFITPDGLKALGH